MAAPYRPGTSVQSTGWYARTLNTAATSPAPVSMHQEESVSMSTDLPSSGRRLRPLVTSAFACTLLAAAGAHTQPIYKSVDSTGRVTYSQEPIPGAVSVDKVDVTPKVVVDRPAGAGSAAAPNAAAEAKRAETARQNEDFRQRQQAREAQRQQAIDAVNAAERDLDAAQKALVAGQETNQPGDRQGIGGVRSRPTDQYLERVQRLEAAVEAAKKRLAEAQNRLRDVQ